MTIAFTLAIACVGCDSSDLFNRAGDSYLEAALGTAEITKFGDRGHRMALYDTLGNEPPLLELQGYQLLDNRTHTLSLWIRDPEEGKRYLVGPSGGEAHAIYTSQIFPKDFLRSYSTQRANSGILVLSRFDTHRRIVEGTFEFVVQNNVRFTTDLTAPESVQVMNGRFRLGYHIQGPPRGDGSD